MDLTVCQEQEASFSPDTALTLVVPLNNLSVRIELTSPSGATVEAFNDVLSAGTHQVSLSSEERGEHEVDIYMGDVLFESLRLDFE